VKNYRTHGKKPYEIITLHGGPGALGELKPLSEKLGEEFGVIEYLQTKESIELLLKDIQKILSKKVQSPVNVIGFSWGDWLAVFFADQYPEMVKSLILISSGPFEEKYSKNIHKNRFNRMNDKEKELFEKVEQKFIEGKNVKIKLLNNFVDLMHKVDAYQYKKSNNNVTNFQINLYKKIWNEAAKLRKNNQLIKALAKIDCPIKVIHGDYDPHPYQGVKKPLEKLQKDYEFKLLKKCGHTPWKEKIAKDEFYNTLFNYLSSD
jgi:pimeloyl-ACP methyl ester carboxylesterase